MPEEGNTMSASGIMSLIRRQPSSGCCTWNPAMACVSQSSSTKGSHPPSSRHQTRSGRSRELPGQESDSHPTASGEAVSRIVTIASDSSDPSRRRGPSRLVRLLLLVLRRGG